MSKHQRPAQFSIVSILSRDTYLNMLIVFVMLVAIMLKMLNPPVDPGAEPPPGNLMVSVMWDDGDIDVDTWLDGPGEPRPVGYTNKSGALWNLLRDDTGNDHGLFNFENAYTRGILEGEYTVNLHCYRCPSEVTVKVEISINDGKGKGQVTSTRPILTSIVKITNRQQVTVARFKLTDEGTLVEDSIHNVFRDLRSGPTGDH